MKKTNNKIAVGLDIGTTKIVVMVGQKNEHGKLEIIGVGRSKSLGVHRGVVNNITQTINSIKEAVAQAESDSGYKITDVTVGIAGQHIRSLQHSDYITRNNFEEVIDEEDIKKLINQVHKLVMLPGEEIIHVLPQEFKVDSDGDIHEPMGMYGSRLEANFHVVVGQITSIKNIARCVKSAGLNLAGITLEPIASSSASLSKEEKEAGVALVDIGGGTTDIAVFKDNIIRHTSVIPFGGNVISDDIKIGCSIIEKQAEQLKVKFGSAWPGENKETEIVAIPGLRGREPKEISLKKLSQIIHARVNEILEQVYMELRHYGCEEEKKKLIAGIVLTGGGSKLKHIRQLTEYLTGLDTRIGYSNEHMASGQSDLINSPEYATAVGLVLKGIEKLEEQELYFSPKEDEEFTAESLPTKNKAEQNSLTEQPLNEEKADDKKVDNKKSEKPEREQSSFKPKSSIFSKWTDKFIKMINETE
ncbi:Cell division protein FtsA [Candidatus Ornithobacterium hominis]|uniref:cell division protein FtsA n=1 Tax=Candidatus Ornithobacterium hominis TaxID=2497989 RepID=UPI000E5AA8E2|nr:cell division protein FtsA [Candidatus Ornithobacterium hominis]SZD71661.1 Cell division protein FtsA [Candidatus Ornithobacterium hominis]